MNITNKLAEALRALADAEASFECKADQCGISDCHAKRRSAAEEKAREALAEYDAHRPENLPTIFRVTWEIDAFDAMSPREAAEEAREAMLRAGTTATVFTVLGRDGSITEVDLSEDA